MGINKDQLLLEEILESISWIEKFLENVSREDFLADELVSSAVMYKIQSVGEAVKRLSSEIKTHYSDIAWKQIAGMRDILVHDYTKVDRKAVWRAATHDILVLRDQLTNK